MMRGFGFITIIVNTILIAPQLYADTTYVSGVIDTNSVWTTAGSPYIVVGDVTVDTLVTLDIEPGVEVRLDSAKHIMAKGKLNAIGTVTDSIIISALDTTKRWGRLWFKSASSCSLKYCRIEYAGNSAIYGDSASYLFIGYSNISNNLIPIVDSIYQTYRAYGAEIHNKGVANICNNTISKNSAHVYRSHNGGTGIGGGIFSRGLAIINNQVD